LRPGCLKFGAVADALRRFRALKARADLPPYRPPGNAADIAGHTGLVESGVDHADTRRSDTHRRRARHRRSDVADRSGLVDAGVAYADAWSPDAGRRDAGGRRHYVARCSGLVDAGVACVRTLRQAYQHRDDGANERRAQGMLTHAPCLPADHGCATVT
jgi:hypothetical protein